MNFYVNGFMYSEDEKKIVLIKKNTPEWQRGLFNGIGGSIEAGESPEEAIVREFEEETGVKTDEDEWKLFAIISKESKYKVYFFVAFTDKVLTAKTIEKEEVIICDMDNLPNKMIPNLNWLIPMSLDKEVDFSSPVIINY